MNKTAIVFCGELRTFPICRTTMKFLDQQSPQMDIYFSTCDVTTTVNINQKINLSDIHNRSISGSEIKHMFNNCKAVKIHDFADLSARRRGIPVIEHWRTGLELIDGSGVQYDYVLLLRPDLFFSPNSFFDVTKFQEYNTAIGLAHVPPDDFLPDTVFFSTYKNIKNFVYGYDYDRHLGGDTWHKYLYKIIKDLNLEMKMLPIDGETAIGRYGIEADWTLEQVRTLFEIEMSTRV